MANPGELVWRTPLHEPWVIERPRLHAVLTVRDGTLADLVQDLADGNIYHSTYDKRWLWLTDQWVMPQPLVAITLVSVQDTVSTLVDLRRVTYELRSDQDRIDPLNGYLYRR